MPDEKLTAYPPVPPRPTRDEIQDRLAIVGQLPYRVDDLQPPAPVAIDVDDTFILRVSTSLGVVGGTLMLRILRPDGSIETVLHPIAVAINRTFTPFPFAGTNGWLLSATFDPQTVAASGRATYARLVLIRGGITSFFDSLVLFQGYCSFQTALTWPGGIHEHCFGGYGAIRSITGTVPAAGAEVLETVPAGAIWELLTFKATLTTAVGGGVRAPSLVLDDGVNILYQQSEPTGQGASTTFTYEWAGGINAFSAVGLFTQHPLPVPMFLAGGFRIRTISGLNAGDQFSAVQYSVMEWLQG